MPYIECLNTKDDSRKYFAITKPIVSIGSKSGNDILLIKGDVGTHHARIVKRGRFFHHSTIGYEATILCQWS